MGDKISNYTNTITTLIDTMLFDVSDPTGAWESKSMTWLNIRTNIGLNGTENQQVKYGTGGTSLVDSSFFDDGTGVIFDGTAISTKVLFEINDTGIVDDKISIRLTNVDVSWDNYLSENSLKWVSDFTGGLGRWTMADLAGDTRFLLEDLGTTASIDLRVVATDYARIALDAGGNPATIRWYGATGTYPDTLDIYSGVYVTGVSDQLVGINQPVPTAKLNVKGQSTTGIALIEKADGTDLWQMNSDGEIGHNTTPTANVSHHIKSLNVLSSEYSFLVTDSAGANMFEVRNDSFMGFGDATQLGAEDFSFLGDTAAVGSLHVGEVSTDITASTTVEVENITGNTIVQNWNNVAGTSVAQTLESGAFKVSGDYYSATLQGLSGTYAGVSSVTFTGGIVTAATAGGGGGPEAFSALPATTGTVDFDVDTSVNQKVSITGNITLTMSNQADGDEGTLIITQAGTGGYTIALPAGSKTMESIPDANLLSPVVSDVDILDWKYDGTTIFWTINDNFG